MKSLKDLQRETEHRAEVLAPLIGISFLAPVEEHADELRDQEYLQSLRDNMTEIGFLVEQALNLKLYFQTLESIYTISNERKELP